MDLFKELIELNNKIELQKLAKEIYESASDDDDDEIQFIKETRENFIKKYDKKNNRQFRICSTYNSSTE